MNTSKRTMTLKFKSTLMIAALSAAFLAGCGGTDELEPPVAATAVATDSDVSVTPTKNGSRSSWILLPRWKPAPAKAP
jgi:predicted small lipoprotein YifL